MKQYHDVVSELLGTFETSDVAMSVHTQAIQMLAEVEQGVALIHSAELGEALDLVELLVVSVVARAVLLRYAHPNL